MTKNCFKCQRELPVDDFYRHAAMADGRLGKCKACTRADVRANREAKRDYYLEYDRQRWRKPERKAAIRASQQHNREHHLARVAVHNAVRRGKLQRQPCEVCGSEKVEAHHEDYSQRLAVSWLCRKHHAERHRF